MHHDIKFDGCEKYNPSLILFIVHKYMQLFQNGRGSYVKVHMTTLMPGASI